MDHKALPKLFDRVTDDFTLLNATWEMMEITGAVVRSKARPISNAQDLSNYVKYEFFKLTGVL